MQLQHGRNPYIRGGSWKGTSQNGTREDKGSKGMENTNKGQGCREFPQIRQLLLTIYPQFQLQSKTIKQAERQEGMEMGGRTSKGVQGTQGKDH